MTAQSRRGQGTNNAKFNLNLQGVQDRTTKLRKILSMRDPVTLSAGREGESDEGED
jgi:hypothetical protein